MGPTVGKSSNILGSDNFVGFVKIGIYTMLLLGIYSSALSWLITIDWTKEDFTYCLLIPLIAVYLVWDKRITLSRCQSVKSWEGMVPFCVGIIFFWLGELSGEFFTLYISFWLVMVGIVWLEIGWTKTRVIAFALVFILAMFPLPNFLYNKVSVALKLVSSQLGVGMMRLYGMSAYREGNVIDLGFTQLQVVDACSGLRYLIPLIVLGFLLAYFYRASFWKRALVVISTVPLSIITNSLRIALTGILYEVWGAEVAEGFFHGFSGWFIFMFSLVVLLVEMWLLNKVFLERHLPSQSFGFGRARRDDGQEQGAPAFAELRQGKKGVGHTAEGQEHLLSQSLGEARRAEGIEYGATHEEARMAELQSPAKKGLKAFFSPPQFVVAVILLAATLGLSHGIEFREKIPISKSLIEFPLSVGEWTGTLQSMEQRFIDTLDLSDYVIVDFKNKLGRQVNFYVAYYESQRKGESIHSPATCLPGSGWIFSEAGESNIPVLTYEGESMRVNRAFMQKAGYRQLSYYWFPQRGRILTNAYQLKIYAFWDALTKQRTDGALVRVITPVYDSEELKDAEARLQAFMSDIVPVLDEYIPGKDMS
jgi:EpsI family protein